MSRSACSLSSSARSADRGGQRRPVLPRAAEQSPGDSTAGAAIRAKASGRVASVDILRGFTIFWILGGDAIAWSLQDMAAHHRGALAAIATFLGAQLTHVQWDGMHFYDLIFPLLVFVTGVSVVLSLSGTVAGHGHRGAALRIGQRTLLLFVLGLIYYGGASQRWPDIRLLGVLQRIALCYGVAALLFLTLRWRGLILVCLAIVIGYWALLTFVPVPGVEAGSLRPNANLAWWVDAHYLPGKLWDGTQDPEGLLSTVPAIATCLLGVLAGLLLTHEAVPAQRKSLWLMAAGSALLALGYIWSVQLPLIKYLWTSSFVLVTAGYGALLLGATHQLADVWRCRAWARVFIWIGGNGLALYMANNFVDFNLLAQRLVGGDVAAFLDAHLAMGAGHVTAALAGLSLAIWAAYALYSRRIFIRV